MKFSFINPSPPSESTYMVPTAWPPLGILYCAGTLREAGIEVSLLDQPAKRFSLDQAVNWVKKEDPDILGFSVLLSAAKEAPKLRRRILTSLWFLGVIIQLLMLREFCGSILLWMR